MESAIPHIKNIVVDIALLDVVFMRASVRHDGIADGNIEEKVEKTVGTGVEVVQDVRVEFMKGKE